MKKRLRLEDVRLLQLALLEGRKGFADEEAIETDLSVRCADHNGSVGKGSLMKKRLRLLMESMEPIGAEIVGKGSLMKKRLRHTWFCLTC